MFRKLALRPTTDANNFYPRVTQTGDPATAATTPNQQETATGTDSVPNSGMGTAVLNTPDPTTTRVAFDALSGEELASAKGVLALVSFAGSTAFTVTGAPIAKEAGVVEAGVSANLSDRAAIGLTYGGQFSNRETDHGIRGTLAITF
jgi:uncharacterized protein with beta-barrel porin domain